MQFLASDGEHIVEKVTGGKRRALSQLADSLRSQGIEADSVMRDGRSSVAMIREVIANQHDLVVKLAKGRFSNRSGFFGSTAIRLMRKCPCPVLVVNDDHEDVVNSVAIAVDVLDPHGIQHELNDCVIDSALSIDPQSSVDLLYALPRLMTMMVGDDMGGDLFTAVELEKLHGEMLVKAKDQLTTLADTIRERGVAVRDMTLDGRPEFAIPDYTAEHGIELLVMGTVGRSGMDGFFYGNTSERILNRVKCSVLAIKPPGYVSPIRAK